MEVTVYSFREYPNALRSAAILRRFNFRTSVSPASKRRLLCHQVSYIKDLDRFQIGFAFLPSNQGFSRPCKQHHVRNLRI